MMPETEELMARIFREIASILERVDLSYDYFWDGKQETRIVDISTTLRCNLALRLVKRADELDSQEVLTEA